MHRLIKDTADMNPMLLYVMWVALFSAPITLQAEALAAAAAKRRASGLAAMASPCPAGDLAGERRVDPRVGGEIGAVLDHAKLIDARARRTRRLTVPTATPQTPAVSW
jgi:hypothetical protein